MDPDPATFPPVPERRRWRACLFGCGSALFLAMGGCVVWYCMFFRDVTAPDDSDLLPPPRVEVPDADNLYAALTALHPRFDEPRDFAQEASEQLGADGEGVPHPLRPAGLDPAFRDALMELDGLEACLLGIEPVLAEIEYALRRPRCQLPLRESPEDYLAGTRVFQDAHRQFSSRSLVRRSRGEFREASRDLEVAMRLGDRLIRGAEGMFEILIGTRIVQHSWEALESMLHDGELDTAVEARLLARESAWLDDSGLVTGVLAQEYRLTVCFVESVARGEFDDSDDVPVVLRRIYFPRNRALVRFGEVFRELRTLAKRPPSERNVPVRPVSKLRRVLTGTMAIEILADMHRDGFIRGLERIDRGRLAERAGRTLVALRAFERTRGALPADLEALVAAFPALGSVPIDPYSRSPLRYDSERRILWSVGEDGVDGNGDGWETMRDDPKTSRYDLPDWVWKIPPVPADG